MIYKKHIFLLFTFLFCSTLLFGQDTAKTTMDTNTYSIVTFEGRNYIGKILSDDGVKMLIMTKSVGKIFLTKEDGKSITIIKSEKEVVDGKYIGGVGQFTTRYIFTTNALPVKKGKNYAMLSLYGPEVHFAVTDRFGVGLMTTWIASPLAVALKYTFKKEESNSLWNYSIGTIVGTSGYLGRFGGNIGLHFATATYGNRKNNLSLSGGWTYNNFLNLIDGDILKEGTYPVTSSIPTVKRPLSNGPSMGLSGILKVGKNASFIWDNMLLFNNITYSETDYTPLNSTIVNNRTETLFTFVTMPGMRFEKNDETAFQVSVAIVAAGLRGGDFITFPLPMISKFYKF